MSSTKSKAILYVYLTSAANPNNPKESIDVENTTGNH